MPARQVAQVSCLQVVAGVGLRSPFRLSEDPGSPRFPAAANRKGHSIPIPFQLEGAEDSIWRPAEQAPQKATLALSLQN